MFIICVFVFLVTTIFAQTKKSVVSKTVSAQSKKKTKKKTKFICQLPASVTVLDLSKSEIFVSHPSNSSSDESQKVEVSTVATDDGTLTYIYTVSGGKIIGSGANVVWDLSNVKPGTYIITSAVDDGRGVWGTTKTKEIKVVECSDCK